MNTLISLAIVFAILLFILKGNRRNTGSPWLFTKIGNIMKSIGRKVFKTLSWLIVRIGYWLLWLIWEFILFIGRAFGALFQMLFSR